MSAEQTGLMTITETLTARIKIQVAKSLIRDLELWRTGDDARFSRMVDGRGAGIGSPDKWLRNLASICANPLVVALCPEFVGQVGGRLAAVGLKIPD